VVDWNEEGLLETIWRQEYLEKRVCGGKQSSDDANAWVN